MDKLSRRQKEVLDFIVARRRAGEIPPTLDEIRVHFGWRAIGTVQDHVRALLDKGALRRSRGARTLEPTGLLAEAIRLKPAAENASAAAAVPEIGEVAAGSPILAEENLRDEWYLDRRLLRGEGNFLLRVKGESMIGAQIKDGDYVLVRPQATAESGEIVVARIGEEATVKRFFRLRDRLELRPENPAYPVYAYRAGDDEVEVVGKVVGVMRRY